MVSMAFLRVGSAVRLDQKHSLGSAEGAAVVHTYVHGCPRLLFASLNLRKQTTPSRETSLWRGLKLSAKGPGTWMVSYCLL